MRFAPRHRRTEAQTERAPWKVLMVDDEASVHQVTELALSGLQVDGKGLQFIRAYSAAEAKNLLDQHRDVAVILVDVVMESDDAGLEFIDYVRSDLGNRLVRIILRTGQPGLAPEQRVILKYDINDYREKTELSAGKLTSVLVTALRGYRDLLALNKSRIGLETIISASRALYQVPSMEQFISGVILQLEALLGLEEASFFSKAFGVIRQDAACDLEQQRIVAGTGDYAAATNLPLKDVVSPSELDLLKRAASDHNSLYERHGIVVTLTGSKGCEGILYLGGGHRELDEVDRNLLDVFTSNASIALNNLFLNQEIEFTQREILYTLGEIAEFRSRETGRHVARVSKGAQLLARKLGMSEEEANTVMLAAAMHDLGKIAIPENILNKPGRLTGDEFELMKKHTELGHNLLKGSHRPLLRAAATICLEHHEKWDGSGYPKGLAGERIHIYGRIAAVADVLDALGNQRCYKQAWETDEIVAYFKEQRGRHFDPLLTDLLLENMDEFLGIREEYRDSVADPSEP